MSHKFEIANLLSVEQAISARRATCTLDESELLIEADRVHTDADQFRGLTNVNRSRQILKDKPWSYVQSQEKLVVTIAKPVPGMLRPFCSSTVFRRL